MNGSLLFVTTRNLFNCMISAIRMKLALLAGTLATASLLQAAPFSSLIEEEVDIYFTLRSIVDLRTDWAGHPFAQVVESEALHDFFEPLLAARAEPEDEEGATDILKNEFGLSWDELFELFPGQLALASYNVPDLIMGRAEHPELLLLAEYAGDPEQLEALMQVQFERNAESQKAVNPAIEHTMIRESFMGETLHFDETFDGVTTYIEDGYALVEGIFILATPEARLRSAVEAIKDRPEAPLSENAAYLRSREEGGRGDLQFYFNLEALLPPLNTEMLNKALASGAAMFGISEQSLDAALSLKSLQALFFDMDLIESGLRSNSGVIYREKSGLHGLITYSGDPLPAARYVPKGIFSSSVTSFDFGQMMLRLENLLVTASPIMRFQIDAQLQTIRTNTKVDLRTALFENFGGDLVTLSILPELGRESATMSEPDQVVVVGLKDAEALSSALEVLKDLLPGLREQIETKEFAGETIYTVRAAPNPQMPDAVGSTFSYAITRSKFICCFGRVGLLQEVLSALETGADGFWQLAETEALFERIVQPGAVSRSYVDLDKLMRSIFQSLVQISQFGGDANALDTARIPANLHVPFHLISETNEAEDGLFSRALILERETSE